MAQTKTSPVKDSKETNTNKKGENTMYTLKETQQIISENPYTIKFPTKECTRLEDIIEILESKDNTRKFTITSWLNTSDYPCAAEDYYITEIPKKGEQTMQDKFNKILEPKITDAELKQIAYQITKKKNDRVQYMYDNKKHTTERKVKLETVKLQLEKALTSNPELVQQLVLSLRITNILSKKVGK